MIKAAFFDMDGTLMSHKTHCILESAKSAIAKLQERGILCVVATGRQIRELEKLPIDGIFFDAYLTLNGQMMLDKQKNVLFSVPITGSAKEFLVEKFRDHTYPAMMVEGTKNYLNYISDHVLAVQKAISSDLPPLGTYGGGEIYQVCAYLRPEEEYLLEPIADACVLSRWHFGGMDIIAKGGGKMVGIKRYLEQIGISREEIIAFGDAENDREMLGFAGIGVAMGNADQQTKALADYITADIDDDGIAKALRHFNLI